VRIVLAPSFFLEKRQLHYLLNAKNNRLLGKAIQLVVVFWDWYFCAFFGIRLSNADLSFCYFHILDKFHRKLKQQALKNMVHSTPSGWMGV
jgi:hypothetical protein